MLPFHLKFLMEILSFIIMIPHSAPPPPRVLISSCGSIAVEFSGESPNNSMKHLGIGPSDNNIWMTNGGS